MKIPRSSDAVNEFFRSVISENDSRITVRPMFGNLASFANGNMFAGLFGEKLFVRLSDDDQKELLDKKGAEAFEPMEGRQMKGYIVLPEYWMGESEMVKPWIVRALEFASSLPAKPSRKSGTKKREMGRKIGNAGTQKTAIAVRCAG